MNDLSQVDFCLLIPCYNNVAGLVRSLKSVVYAEDRFLVLVVDDGSTVPVDARIVQQELGPSFPMMLIRNDRNMGITASLNQGLEWILKESNARYVARLDCGDTCDIERFRLETNYLDSNQEVGLVGSWCRFEEQKTGKGYVYETVTQHEQIVKSMHFRNVFIHPCVMFRLSVVQEIGLYPSGFELAEDYAYFWKMMEFSRVHVIDRILVTCEMNKGGLSYKNKSKQLVARWKVIKHFSTNTILKLAGFMRLIVLLLMPKELVLWLKSTKG